MIQLAIIGPTASGKSDLAIKVAKKIDAYILSIDSLSIYKEIDIVSAKPSHEELRDVKHFGIDFLHVDDYFSVDIFINLYKEVLQICQKEKKNLIIVGGTSFYLKSLIDGLSEIPKITEEQSLHVKKKLKNLQDCYDFLYSIDNEYMKNISRNDSYRIEKALLLHVGSKLTPTEWFKQNPPKPVIKNIDIFNIVVQRDILRERIFNRTKKMLDTGLINEVAYLEQKYTRAPHAMNSIGIVETLKYIDGFISKDEMLEEISTHTAQLAKRQQTFNKTQFQKVISAPLDDLEALIYSTLKT